MGKINALFVERNSTDGPVNCQSREAVVQNRGDYWAIASSARQAGPSLGLAFIGPRCQVQGILESRTSKGQAG